MQSFGAGIQPEIAAFHVDKKWVDGPAVELYSEHPLALEMVPASIRVFFAPVDVPICLRIPKEWRRTVSMKSRALVVQSLARTGRVDDVPRMQCG